MTQTPKYWYVLPCILTESEGLIIKKIFLLQTETIRYVQFEQQIVINKCFHLRVCWVPLKHFIPQGGIFMGNT